MINRSHIQEYTYTLSPCLRFRTFATHNRNPSPKLLCLSSIATITDLTEYISLNRIHFKVSQMLGRVKLDRDAVILASHFITYEENHTPKVWSDLMIVLVAQVWFPWRRGEEVGEYGMLDAALYRDRKVCRAWFNWLKSTKYLYVFS